MRLLLDTHVLIWFSEDAPQLSDAARAAIENRENSRYYSVASIWEMAIKIQFGKLRVGSRLGQAYRKRLLANDFDELPIGFLHAASVSNLPLHHRDPFDRLLITQAKVESLTLVSHDQRFDAYEVPRLW